MRGQSSMLRRRLSSLCVFVLAAVALILPRSARADDMPKASDDGDAADKKKDDSKDGDSRKDGWHYNAEIDGLYLRGNSTIVRGSNQDGTGLGFTVGTEGQVTGSYSIIQVHFDYQAHLGGGATGLDGAYRSNFLGGVYAPITEHFGPYVRVGAGGEYRGNDSYLYSHLDLPEGQVGFTGVWEGYSIEAGAVGGITLGGRYSTGNDQKRSLDGAPMGGGYAQLHILPIYLRGEYRTYAQRRDSPAPEEWSAKACGALPIYKDGTAAPFLICFDGSWLHGAGTPPGASASTDSRATYMGLSIGLGALVSGAGKESKDRPSDDKAKPDDKRDNPRTDPTPPDSPQAAAQGVLDADDTRRMTQEAMSYLGGARIMTEWLAQSPRPAVIVLPFTNKMSAAVAQPVLESPRREAESWFLRSQTAVVIDRPAADRALAGKSLDDPGDIARDAHARYACTGWIEQRPSLGEKNKTIYALTVRVVDTQQNAIVWQRETTMTKITQQPR